MEYIQGGRGLLSVIISLYHGLRNILTNFHELKKSTKKGPPDLFIVCLATKKSAIFVLSQNVGLSYTYIYELGAKAPTMMPTDCSVLCAPTTL